METLRLCGVIQCSDFFLLNLGPWVIFQNLLSEIWLLLILIKINNDLDIRSYV